MPVRCSSERATAASSYCSGAYPARRDAASSSLVNAGFLVSVAENGLQAMQALEKTHPDIILLDVIMPEMNGFDTTIAIRRLPGYEQIPILIMTALDDLDSINRAFEVGATDYITKPLDTKQFLDRIGKYL